jgi:hypothetical protein
MATMACRELDADPQAVMAGIVPRFRLLTGLAQNPLADRENEAGFLGNRYEAIRSDETQLRVVPANQRFHAVGLATAAVNLRQSPIAECTILRADCVPRRCPAAHER